MFSHKQDSELNDIIEGFKMFASDEGGLINPNELKEIMETMNMNIIQIVGKTPMYLEANFILKQLKNHTKEKNILLQE